MILYHYTCMFCAAQIRRDGKIVPKTQPTMAGTPVIWLGDFRQRTDTLRARLGLNWHGSTWRPCASENPPCDPAAARFGVMFDPDHPHIHPFTQLAQDFPDAAATYRALPGAQPWRWWFSTAPITLTGGTPPHV